MRDRTSVPVTGVRAICDLSADHISWLWPWSAIATNQWCRKRQTAPLPARPDAAARSTAQKRLPLCRRIIVCRCLAIQQSNARPGRDAPHQMSCRCAAALPARNRRGRRVFLHSDANHQTDERRIDARPCEYRMDAVSSSSTQQPQPARRLTATHSCNEILDILMLEGPGHVKTAPYSFIGDEMLTTGR